MKKDNKNTEETLKDFKEELDGSNWDAYSSSGIHRLKPKGKDKGKDK
jgi:hypothetical protein